MDILPGLVCILYMHMYVCHFNFLSYSAKVYSCLLVKSKMCVASTDPST